MNESTIQKPENQPINQFDRPITHPTEQPTYETFQGIKILVTTTKIS